MSRPAGAAGRSRASACPSPRPAFLFRGSGQFCHFSWRTNAAGRALIHRPDLPAFNGWNQHGGLPFPLTTTASAAFRPEHPMKVSDFFVARLHAWGVRRIYGYPGDGINGVLGALQRAGSIEFIQVRHEEMAAF